MMLQSLPDGTGASQAQEPDTMGVSRRIERAGELNQRRIRGRNKLTESHAVWVRSDMRAHS
jgi:hypothetical protein